MKYNEIDKQRLVNIKWHLVFGLFAILSSLIFAWMMYFLPPVLPPLKLFLFPVVCCFVGTGIILQGLEKKYIAYKIQSIAFSLLGMTFIIIFNNAPWYALIIPTLFIVMGLIAFFQPFSSTRGY